MLVPGANLANGDCSPYDGPWGANALDFDSRATPSSTSRRNGLQLVGPRHAVAGAPSATIAFEAPVPGVGPPLKDPQGNGMRPYAEVDVLAEDGTLLFQSVSSFSSIQYSDSGDLEFAMLPQPPPGSPGTKTVHIARAGDYLLYDDPAANTGSYTGDFAIHPVGGATERHLSVHAPEHPWAPVAAITLEPGDYEVTITGGAGDYLLLPAGTPPPVVP